MNPKITRVENHGGKIMHITETVRCRRSEVRAGDILVDILGRPFFQVDSVHPAKATGYIVFFGKTLHAEYDGVTAGGYKDDTVLIALTVRS